MKFVLNREQNRVEISLELSEMGPYGNDAILKDLPENIQVTKNPDAITFSITSINDHLSDGLSLFVDYSERHAMTLESELRLVIAFMKEIEALQNQISTELFKAKHELNERLLQSGLDASEMNKLITKYQKEIKAFSKEAKDGFTSLKSRIKSAPLTQGLITQLLKYQDQVAGPLKGAIISAEYDEPELYNLRKDLIQSRNKIKHIISKLSPVLDPGRLRSTFLDAEKSIERYVLNENILSQLGIQDVHRIACYINSGREFAYDKDANCAIIEITDKKKNKRFVELPRNLLSLKELKETLRSKGAYVDVSSAQRGHGALGEEFFKGLNQYTRQIEDDYANIHREISSTLQDMVSPHEVYEFIFIGCGQGKEVKELLKILEKEGIRYRLYGIDLDKDNIAAARSDADFVGKNVQFIEGDANNFVELIKVLRTSFSDIIPTTTITVSSGFCTRKVNKDPVEAYDIFKIVMHNSDYFIISGRTETLINSRDAKNAGVKDEQRTYLSDGQPRTIDTFSAIDAKQQAANILAKYKVSNEKIITLRDNVAPIPILQLLVEELKTLDGFTLDLRGAVIDLMEMVYVNADKSYKTTFEFLNTVIKQNNLTIIATENEPWLSTIQDVTDKIKISPSTYTTMKDPFRDLFVRERPKVSDNVRDRASNIITKLGST